jgi:hypothetical protein
MILSYKKQFPWGAPTDFEQKIIAGTKIHTFREDPHGRWKPGRKIHHATGVRTKNYNCFQEDDCEDVQPVHIEWSKRSKNFVTIYIANTVFYTNQGGITINFHGMCRLARNDGFECTADFFKWFNTDFRGKIIHWTDFRY